MCVLCVITRIKMRGNGARIFVDWALCVCVCTRDYLQQPTSCENALFWFVIVIKKNILLTSPEKNH